MLRIRPEQLLSLQQPRIDAYLEKILPVLEEKFPDPYENQGGDEGVTAIVHNALSIAQHNGLEREGDVTALASLMLVFGGDLLDQPDNGWMRETLRSTSIANEDKMTMILERMAAT
ncbi:hypothetical protein DB30_05567 [Enhygromyxa salina]|uniref:Uncharacterized protein n=1 Tax=Enhygromyxa salina TaxID=215803 RepID=A0A0C2D0S7_9BACT|nr:hypothetical protein [Enhygromyxa salina]KIG15450.1 hypothetical protein DB30_05567 [Enhygromyxa salina]